MNAMFIVVKMSPNRWSPVFARRLSMTVESFQRRVRFMCSLPDRIAVDVVLL